MKRVGHLWERLISFENLLAAARKARRGKRFRKSVARFEYDLEPQLWQLHEELRSKTYQPGPFRTFTIREPKPRVISAAPFRDRVVHHALTRVLEPIFEPTFVFDSYACRTGKGTHAAVDRCQQFVRRYRYVLQADIRKFFPSVDLQILQSLVARKIKDPHVLWLVWRILDHGQSREAPPEWFPGDELFTPLERPRGLPIGNQTSQFLANVYLNPLDHFVIERLRIPGYVRYVDDFLLFSDDRQELKRAQRAVGDFLVRLRLRLHPTKNVVFPTTQPVRFLGYRVFSTHRLLARENVIRFRHRMRRLQRAFAAGQIEPAEIQRRLMSWSGHARQANTYRLRRRLFRTITFQRATAEPTGVAGRLVQQSGTERPLCQPQPQPADEPEQQHWVPPGEHFAAGQ